MLWPSKVYKISHKPYVLQTKTIVLPSSTIPAIYQNLYYWKKLKPSKKLTRQTSQSCVIWYYFKVWIFSIVSILKQINLCKYQHKSLVDILYKPVKLSLSFTSYSNSRHWTHTNKYTTGLYRFFFEFLSLWRLQK